MLSSEEAMQLLNMKKHMVGGDSIDLGLDRIRVDLVSDEGNYKFILDIHLNKKIQLKLSIHHQEDQRKLGLLRLDYKGRHSNPIEAIENLPLEFKPFIGKSFGIDEPHIHRYVMGYKPLVWAIPAVLEGFPEINIASCTQSEDVIRIFAEKIKIKNKLIMQSSLI